MNYQDKIKEIDSVLLVLKDFKKELKKTDNLSNKAMNTHPRNSTPSQIDKASSNLNWACMHLDKQHKNVWKTILSTFLETNIEDREYSPSGFHNYK